MEKALLSDAVEKILCLSQWRKGGYSSFREI